MNPMLHILLDTDRKANTDRLLRALCAETRHSILLVPEQFSHAAERKLCQLGGNRISRHAEVLSFSRLASRVFSEYGGAAETETDKGGKLLMMSLAVDQVRSRLKIYANCAYKPEFLLKLIDTLDEFRSFCVTAQTLRSVSAKLSGVLALKTEEFALLMESYDAVAANLGQNPETKLNRLLSALEGSDYAAGKSFWFDGFTDFNGVEEEIIAQLLSSEAEVTVALLCDGTEHGGQQFEAARKTAQRLFRIAARLGIRARIERFRAEEETPQRFLREHLFGGGNETFELPQRYLTFLTAADAETECRIAAGEILRLVEQGLRWRDITIACPDSAYLPLLRSVLDRAEIPAYFAGNRDIMRRPVVHMLLSALEAAQTLETEPMLAVLKSGYLPLTEAAADRLENYALLWSIRGEVWAREWNMSPYGYRKRTDEAGQALLDTLNADRAAFVSPLLHLRSALRGAKNTAEMTLALNDFLEEIGLRECLSARAEAFYAAGKLQQAQEYAQVYGVICRVLEQLYGVLGVSVHDTDEFTRIFRTALSCYAIGTIPASLDCVNVGSLMSQRRGDTKVLFLLGANEGVFPTASGNQTLLTDSERADLTEAGIDVNPTGAGLLALELAAIDSVLATGNERLYFGATENASYFLRRARRLFPSAAVCTDTDALTSRSTREYLAYLAASPNLWRESSDRLPDLTRTARELSEAGEYDFGALSQTAVRALYDKTLHLSSSRIDKLGECRFAYFLNYGLNARERETAELDASIYGTFVHDVLEHVGREVQRRGGFGSVSCDEVLALADERMELYAKTELSELWESARAEYLFRRTFAEVRMVVRDLYEELRNSEFEPTWFELHFADCETLPSVRIVGEKMTAKLTGFVDRVDTWRSGDRVFARVIDYKTGKKSFDYTKVFHGLGLQMLLYLFALERHGERLLGKPLEAAGVLYFPARIERVTVQNRFDEKKMNDQRQKSQRRSGLLLDREDVLQAMEPCDGSPTYLPYGCGKDGERKGDLASRAQLDTLREHVFRTVARLGDELYGGKVAPNPYYCDNLNNACQWCPYGSVCRDRGEKRWLTKLKTAEEFWKAIEGGEEHG